MEFAAALIEYLVTGTFALFWIWPVVCRHSITIEQLAPGATALAPIAIVVGLLVDSMARIIPGTLKVAIRKRFNQPSPEILAVIEEAPCPSDCHDEFLAYHSPKLYTEFQVRSARDRMARGAALNCLMLLVVGAIHPQYFNLWDSPSQFGWFAAGCVIATGSFFACWVRFEGLSYRWRLNAIYVTILNQGAGGRPKE